MWISYSVNSAKTNTVIIPAKRTKAPISHFNPSSNGTPINTVSSAKYLEVIINNELNFHEQIKVMEGKWLTHLEYVLNKLR